MTLRQGMLALALVCGLAGGALAGSGPVQVYGNWAHGDLAAAHNAGGPSYVGCWSNSDLTGPPLYYCEANDGAGGFNFCYTQSTHLGAALQSITSTSDLQFGWAPDHSCIWVTVSNNSHSAGRR